MSTRLTPISVADREIKRWREREAKLNRELWAVTQQIEQWETVRFELARQAEDEAEAQAEAEVVS
jgi:hypothetical protein